MESENVMTMEDGTKVITIRYDCIDESVSSGSSLPDYVSCYSDENNKYKKIPEEPNSSNNKFACFLDSSTSSMYKPDENVEANHETLLKTDKACNQITIQRFVVPKTKSLSRYYRICSMCKTQNSEQCYQFCSSCFNVRLQEYDSEPGPKPKSIKRIINKLTVHKEDDNGDKEIHSSSKDVKKAIKQLCNICLVHPQNGLFNHGKIGHVYCCYKCANKIWVKKGKCPICNQKVKGVTKILVK